jgi:hypothetical protein
MGTYNNCISTNSYYNACTRNFYCCMSLLLHLLQLHRLLMIIAEDRLLYSGPVVSTLPVCSGPITYTFTYTDCAGATYTWVHTTTVSPPTVTTMPAPGSSTVACPAAASAPTPPVVNDNCGRPLTVSVRLYQLYLYAVVRSLIHLLILIALVLHIHGYILQLYLRQQLLQCLHQESSTVACPAAASAPTPPVVNDNCGDHLTVSGPVVSTLPVCSGPIHLYIYVY